MGFLCRSRLALSLTDKGFFIKFTLLYFASLILPPVTRLDKAGTDIGPLEGCSA